MAVFVVLDVVAVVALQLQGRMTHSVFVHEQRTEAVSQSLRIVHGELSVHDNVRRHAHDTRADRAKVDVVDAAGSIHVGPPAVNSTPATTTTTEPARSVSKSRRAARSEMSSAP